MAVRGKRTDEKHTPPHWQYDPLEYWMQQREINARNMRSLVGSWMEQIGYLELRLPGFVPSGECYERYQQMCAFWRVVTNSRLRSRRVTYGGYRSVEFIDTGIQKGTGDSMIDVYFCVVTRTRFEALTILSEWLDVTKQRYNRILTYCSTGEFDETRIDSWDAPKVWREVIERLKRHRNVMLGIGDQRIGSRKAFENLFCPASTWRPLFRFKWIIPFGDHDAKCKTTSDFVAPPRPGYELVLVEERKERVVRVEMPPSWSELRRVARAHCPAVDAGEFYTMVERFCETGQSVDDFVCSLVRHCEALLSSCCQDVAHQIGLLVDATHETPDEWCERKYKEKLREKLRRRKR